MATIWTPDTSITPSQQSGYARSQADAAYPSLWDGVQMAVFPGIHRTRYLHDFSGRWLMDPVDLGAAYEGEYRYYGNAWGREHDNVADTTQFTTAIDTLVPRANVTILLGHVKTDGTIRSNNAFQSTSGTTSNRCRCILPHTDGKVYFDFAGGVEGSTRCS
jgi:hypothetical protein